MLSTNPAKVNRKKYEYEKLNNDIKMCFSEYTINYVSVSKGGYLSFFRKNTPTSG